MRQEHGIIAFKDPIKAKEFAAPNKGEIFNMNLYIRWTV
jgi:hypothetical protein